MTEFATETQPIGQRLATGLAKLGLAIKHEERSASANRGVSPTQGQILVALVDAPQRMTALSNRLGLTPATVSESVDALEGKGLVQRQPLPNDGRVVMVEATTPRSLAGRRVCWLARLSLRCDRPSR